MASVRIINLPEEAAKRGSTGQRTPRPPLRRAALPSFGTFPRLPARLDRFQTVSGTANPPKSSIAETARSHGHTTRILPQLRLDPDWFAQPSPRDTRLSRSDPGVAEAILLAMAAYAVLRKPMASPTWARTT
ncbi:MAG: hypothetical protein AAF311_01130 [Pseudomonadota bacterium]